MNSTTWVAVKQFQSHLAEVISNVKYICITYGLFIPIAMVTQLHCIDLIFQKGIKSNAFLKKNPDTYRQNSDHFSFCQSCINDI